MLSEKNNFNPYTRKKLKKSDILICNLRLKDLDKHEDAAANSHPEMTPEQLFNDSVLKIFQKMDELNVVASGTCIRWFTELSFSHCGVFTRCCLMSGLIGHSYRSLSEHKIVPNKNVFRQFTYSISHITDKRKLQQTILKDMDTLVSSGISQEDKAGCYYILIALTDVSAQVAQELPWLVHIDLYYFFLLFYCIKMEELLTSKIKEFDNLLPFLNPATEAALKNYQSEFDKISKGNLNPKIIVSNQPKTALKLVVAPPPKGIEGIEVNELGVHDDGVVYSKKDQKSLEFQPKSNEGIVKLNMFDVGGT